MTKNDQKLKLQNLKSINEVKIIISSGVKLQYKFIFQYLDPNFNGYVNLEELGNIRDMGIINVLKQMLKPTKKIRSNVVNDLFSLAEALMYEIHFLGNYVSPMKVYNLV